MIRRPAKWEERSLKFLNSPELPWRAFPAVWHCDSDLGLILGRPYPTEESAPFLSSGMEAELMISRPVLLLLLLTAVMQTGCVHRRVTVNSYPQGALVKVDGRDIGYTPASFDFTWYGTREVQLLMDGYETRTEHVDINAPWYQKFPLDFVSDNFLGKHVTDHRQFTFQLEPKRIGQSNDVLQRAGSLRSEALHGQ
jgi:hypothetical protein